MAASLKSPRHGKTVVAGKKPCLVGKEYDHVVNRSKTESVKSKGSKRKPKLLRQRDKSKSVEVARATWLGKIKVWREAQRRRADEVK